MSSLARRRGRQRQVRDLVEATFAPSVELLEPRQLLSASTATVARIDAGGPAYTDSLGNQWSVDTDYTGGSVSNTPYAVANTSDPALIYSRRWGDFSYNIPLADGTYSLSLYFAEPRDTGPNQRLFNVSAQGAAILTNFDIYAAAGYQTEITKTFTVAVTSGSLNLTFADVKDVACVSAIQAIQTSATPPALPTSAHLDAGGPAYIDSTGTAWAADEFFSGGSVSNTPYTVANTNDPALIYSRRWGNFSYNIPLADGSYTLSLYFAEPRDTGPNQRLFDVTAQGTPILTNFDIYSVAGYQTEVTETFTIAVTNGSLNLTFADVKDVACVSAIAVVPAGAAPPTNPPPSSTPLASPWTDTDIGSVGESGSASQLGDSNPVITLTGGGADIWNDADAFNFAYQSLTGDGQIIVQVTSEGAANGWSKAGVMIRETTAADSRFVDLVLSPNHGVAMQDRSLTNNAPADVVPQSAASAGIWLELSRTGSTITGLISTNGTTWTTFGSITMDLPNTVLLGLCVTAHDNTKLETAGFANVSISGDGTAASPWAVGTSDPVMRWESDDATVNGLVYVFGGFTNQALDATPDCDSYDPATGIWTPLANMPLVVTHAATVAVGDIIYLAGGYVGQLVSNNPPITNEVQTYNIDTNTWGTIAPLPAAITAGGIACINNVLYFYGGLNAGRATDSAKTWAFDLNNPSAGWVQKANMPDPRNHIGYTSVNGIAYAIGGIRLLDESTNNDASVDAYDPVTNTWTAVASLPFVWSHFNDSTISVDGKIVIVGGQTNGGYDGTYLPNIEEYDPSTNAWTALTPLPEERQAAVAVWVDDELVVIDGAVDNIGGWPQSEVWIDNSLDI